MGGKELKFSLLFVVVLLFGCAGVVMADWNPGEPNKMHFPQLPEAYGWDIAFRSYDEGPVQLELADDWVCTETGPVRDIHFWVSWQDDYVGTIPSVRVKIYSNNPSGQYGYSEPNELLWQRNFPAGEFIERWYGSGEQGWYDPYWGNSWWPDHQDYFQINITDINDPFIQQEGEIYWLSIRIDTVDGEIGWKTADVEQYPEPHTGEHFMDDAVYRWQGGQWWELHDPIVTVKSLDLSFVITSNEEEPMVKWAQMPDETTKGIDIRIDSNDLIDRTVADDFECNQPSLITDVHFWGSWKDDIKGNISKIHLSIHEDIPEGDPCNPTNYSIPGQLLWEKDFFAGEFVESLYYTLPGEDYEWFWDVYYDRRQPLGDQNIWRYDIYIDPSEAFLQLGTAEEPIIYWLDIYVEVEDGFGEFGWKTSIDHWNDKAVLRLPGPYWWDLTYPSDHPYAGQWIDMAFMITGEEVMLPKPLMPHTKWSQPPVEIDPTAITSTYCGWDEPSLREWIEPDLYFPCWDCPTQCYGDTDCDTDVDADDLERYTAANGSIYGGPDYDHCADFDRDFDVDGDDGDILWSWIGRIIPSDCPEEGDIPDPQSWRIVADDFRCLGTMPVTSIHWWGSYVEWDGNEPPLPEPIAWRIGFWSNIRDPDPSDPLTFSYPRRLLWQIEVPAERVDVNNVGQDYFPYVPFEDTCFQYYVDLEPDEYFWQSNFEPNTMDKVFWLSIAAVYPEDYVPDVHRWGWKTRPWHWMDDAVTFQLDDDPEPGMPPLNIEFNNITPIEVEGESYDVAFELDTDPNYIKWEQLYAGIRNWPHYEDERSMYSWTTPGSERYVFDDWRCLRRTPVTAIVWWGSYIGYGYEACGQGPFMDTPVPPDYFALEISTDSPAGSDPCYPFSHPNEPIWDYVASEYDEVLVGYDKHPDGGPNEPVFRYSVRLPEDAWFHQPDYNGVFWLSIHAVYVSGDRVPNYEWGWTNHQHVFNDNAVVGYGDDVWVWEELYDQTGKSEDMSFMLFTDPNLCSTCANYNCDALVNFVDYADFADNWLWTGAAGGYNNSDLNCDGSVDLYDLKIFVEQWLDSCP
jgi:hypothetical protein